MHSNIYSTVAAVLFALSPALAAERADVDYQRDIKPLLRARCYSCHGVTTQEAGLRLDTGVSLRRGGDSGPAVEAGNAERSLILQRVRGAEGERMPPEGEPLSSHQVGLLVAWINRGAPSPADEKPQIDPRDHWSFQPPRRWPLPPVQDPTWLKVPLDAFVAATLQREGVAPSPAAGRTTLIRRLYLDLLGLPPSPAEVDEFLADSRPDAYERLVDRVLASPAFGERWGRHWLDLARYADSNGYEDDRMRPDAWRYRDWVIDAVNRDMPFDRFTIDQLAGDLLPEATFEQRVATGFHRMSLSNEGGADSVEEEYRIIAVKDRVDTTGSIWLGLSVGCGKCHSHKYDPLTQREYYQLFAFFNDAEDTSIPAPPLSSKYMRQYTQALEKFNQRLAEIKASLAGYEEKVLAQKIARWAAAHDAEAESVRLGEIRKLLSVSAERRALKDQLKLGELLGPVDPEYAAVMGNQLLNSGNNRPLPPSSHAMVVAAKQRMSHVHRRGNFLDLAEEVEPATPGFLPPADTTGPRASRLDLARWIVAPRNPLTSRVAVNRIWGLLIGRGLVAAPDEFGIAGTPPSHPELLDCLATDYMDRMWSRKAMIRRIVTSSTYRQTSQRRDDVSRRDPDNLLIARQARRRVEAECVRDLALSAAGILNRATGGPSFQPQLPDGLQQIEELKNEQFLETSSGADRYRRGVYINVQRMFMLPMLQTFDVADPNAACARRERSNTPLQALTMLNDPVFVDAAGALARRIVAERAGSVSQRIVWGFRLCLAREPDADERQTLEQLYKQLLSLYRQQPDTAGQLAGHEAWPVPLGDAEAAAWVGLARTLLNLDEFITRE